MKRFAIFDLDGTLLNTLDDLAAASNCALANEGLPQHPVEAYRVFVGNGVAKLIERITPEGLRKDDGLLARLRKSFDVYYSAHGQDLTRPYDGVVPMLDGLLAKGFGLAVLSNKPHGFVQNLTPYYFGQRFRAVYGQREGYPTKPDASLVAEVWRRWERGPKKQYTWVIPAWICGQLKMAASLRWAFYGASGGKRS